jgi:hypothetical protein
MKIGLSRAVKTRLMKKLEMDRVGNHWWRLPSVPAPIVHPAALFRWFWCQLQLMGEIRRIMRERDHLRTKAWRQAKGIYHVWRPQPQKQLVAGGGHLPSPPPFFFLAIAFPSPPPPPRWVVHELTRWHGSTNQTRPDPHFFVHQIAELAY